MRVVRKLRQAISAIKYLNHQTLPNVNGRLNAIVNNIGDQFRASQAAHNTAYPKDKTTIADFWSEWIKAFYVWAVSHVKTQGTESIRLVRQTWETSPNAGAAEILEFLSSFESDLKILTVDTSKMK